jgi:hypothetical protein
VIEQAFLRKKVLETVVKQSLAFDLTANLCGDNPEFWAEAERATVASLERRIELWNGAHKRILEGVGM